MVARILFTQELAERLRPDGITVNAVHPGLITGTRLLLDVGGPFRWMTDRFGKTPEQAADTPLWLATSPDAAHETGKLWHKRKPLRTPGQGSDPVARKRLWDESARLVGLGGGGSAADATAVHGVADQTGVEDERAEPDEGI
jgi:hypothetical protein